MCVERLLVAPGLDDREVIGTHGVLDDVETDVAGLFAALLGKLLQHHRDLGVGRNVHMRDDNDMGCLGASPAIIETDRLVRALIVVTDTNRL